MKKVLIGFGLFALVFASTNSLLAKIDNNYNFSAAYIRTFTRSGAISGADISHYNPAGLVKIDEGLYLELDSQTIFKEYRHQDVDDNTNPGTLDTDNAYKNKQYADNKLVPFFPGFYAAWKFNDEWAAYFNLVFPTGGGVVEFNNGADLAGHERNGKGSGSFMTYGPTAGAAYAVNKMFSVSLGMRVSILDNSGTSTFSTNLQGAMSPLSGKKFLDMTQSGTGVTGVLGLNFFEPLDIKGLNIGIKYEHQTAITVSSTQAPTEGMGGYLKMSAAGGDGGALEKGFADVMDPTSANYNSEIMSEVMGIGASMGIDMTTASDEQKSKVIGAAMAAGGPTAQYGVGVLAAAAAEGVAAKNKEYTHEYRHDIPGLASIGIEYNLMPDFKVMTSFVYYLNTMATWEDFATDYTFETATDRLGKDGKAKDYMDEVSNGYDITLGFEYQIDKQLTASIGGIYTKTGANEQTVALGLGLLAPKNDSISYGGGIQYKAMEDLMLNLALSRTYYLEADAVDYNGTDSMFQTVTSKRKVSKDVFDIALSVQYKFLGSSSASSEEEAPAVAPAEGEDATAPATEEEAGQ